MLPPTFLGRNATKELELMLLKSCTFPADDVNEIFIFGFFFVFGSTRGYPVVVCCSMVVMRNDYYTVFNEHKLIS